MPFWPSANHLLLLHVSMDLSKIFRIDVNMDFTINILCELLIEAPKKLFSPKSKKTHFFLFWAQKFAKSIFTSILTVSDKFIEKCRSRDFGD